MERDNLKDNRLSLMLLMREIHPLADINIPNNSTTFFDNLKVTGCRLNLLPRLISINYCMFTL